MLAKLHYQNFKCFDSVSINLSEITLLTGANSSGKSSVIYGIIGAIQSGNFPYQFSPNGKYIRMGDYNEIVHSHSLEKDIALKFIFQDKKIEHCISTIWSKEKIRNAPVLKELHAYSDYYELRIKKIQKYDLSFEYKKDTNNEDKFMNPKLVSKVLESMDEIFERDKHKSENENEEEIEKRKNFKKIIEGYYHKSSFSFKKKIKNIDEYLEWPLNERNYYLDHTIDTISQLIQNYNEKLNFISSFRLYPERTYYESSKGDLTIGRFGENYEDQIIAWETNKSPEYKELLTIIEKIGLFADVKTNRLDGGRYEILIRNKKDGVWSALSDVGFGISQFLPIIVADIQLGDDSTLFIAQPEIHLHPKIQAQFADYIIDRILETNKRYVIETHSEYLLNRIRLAITEKKIKENDVSIAYLENDGEKAIKFDLKFKTNGQIYGAPKGFFDTYMLDVMNIAISAE